MGGSSPMEPMLTTWNLPEDHASRPSAGLWRASPVMAADTSQGDLSVPIVLQPQQVLPQCDSHASSCHSPHKSVPLCGLGGLCSKPRTSTASVVTSEPHHGKRL